MNIVDDTELEGLVPIYDLLAKAGFRNIPIRAFQLGKMYILETTIF